MIPPTTPGAPTWRAFPPYAVPAWLLAGDWGPLNYAAMVLIDAWLERWRQATIARFPSYAGETALGAIGEGRLIPRGRGETVESYRKRLLAWRYPRGHRVRGGPWALLEQVRAALTFAGPPPAYTVDASGNLCVVDDVGGAYYQGSPWTWDGAPGWSRFWVLVDATASTAIQEAPDFGDPALWGGALDPAYAVGLVGVTPEDAALLRSLCESEHPWRPEHTRAEWLCLVLDGAAAGTPDGSYGRWGKLDGGTYVRARDPFTRYIALRSSALQDGGVVQWADAVTLPSSVYTPAAVWHSTITIPGGATLTGDSAHYPLTTTLPDDGSPV